MAKFPPSLFWTLRLLLLFVLLLSSFSSSSTTVVARSEHGEDDIGHVDSSCGTVLFEAASVVLSAVNAFREDLVHRRGTVNLDAYRQDLSDAFEGIREFLQLANGKTKQYAGDSDDGAGSNHESDDDEDAGLQLQQLRQEPDFYVYDAEKPGDCIAKLRAMRQLCDEQSELYVLSAAAKNNDNYGPTEPRGSMAEEMQTLLGNDDGGGGENVVNDMLKFPSEFDAPRAEDSEAEADDESGEGEEPVLHDEQENEAEAAKNFDAAVIEEALRFVPPPA